MYGYSTNELYHHGVKGMKWGIRNYQNADGSLTAEGRARYGNNSSKKVSNKITDMTLKGSSNKEINKVIKNEVKETNQKSSFIKKAIKVGTPIVATIITANGLLYVTSPRYRSMVETGISKLGNIKGNAIKKKYGVNSPQFREYLNNKL